MGEAGGRVSPLTGNRDLLLMNKTNASMIGTSKLVADVNNMHKINMQSAVSTNDLGKNSRITPLKKFGTGGMTT